MNYCIQMYFHLRWKLFTFFTVMVVLVCSSGLSPRCQCQELKSTTTSDTFLPPGATRDADDEKPGILEREFKRKALMFHFLTESPDPIIVTARHQEYRADENIMIYSGDVHIQRGPLSLQADRVIVNTWNNSAELDGDVELRFERDLISADRGILYLDTKEMKLENCRGIIEPSLFFESEILERLYPDPDTNRGRYYFKNVYFTPCSQLTPNWAIKAREVYAKAEGYMHLFGSMFLIKNLPIIWFPYWFYPIKTERSTGFLVPSFGYSSRDKLRLKYEFFWVISDSADLSLAHDYKMEYRNEGDAEFRYALNPQSLGSFKYRYIYEEKDPEKDEEIPEDERVIQLVRGFQIHRFPWDIDWKLNIDYYNNPRVNRLYGENFIDQTQSFTNSWAGFTKNWSNVLTSLNANYYNSSLLAEYKNQKIDATAQRMPSFSIAVPNTRLGNSGLSYSFYTNLDNMILRDVYKNNENNDTLETIDFDLLRLHINPRLRYVFPKSRTWYQVTTDLEFLYTYWSERKMLLWDQDQYDWYDFLNYNKTLQKFYYADTIVFQTLEDYEPHIGARTYYSGDGIVREGYTASIDFSGPIFYRIFDSSSISSNVFRLKHRVWPGVKFTYTPYINQYEIINLDGYIDTLYQTEGLTYYLKSDVIGKVYDPINKVSTIRSIARFSIQQTYDFVTERYYNNSLDHYQKNPEKFIKPTRIYYPYSNITTRLEYFPLTTVWFLLTGDYDPYFNTVQRVNVDLNLLFKKWYIRGGWGVNKGMLELDPANLQTDLTAEDDDIEYIYIASGGQISGHWAASVNSMFNIVENKFHHFNPTITYSAQCWGITVALFARQYRDQVLFGVGQSQKEPYRDEYNIMFTINLKHVGSIGAYDTTEGFGMAP